MVATAVDRIYTEFRDASQKLRDAGEISLSSALDSLASKALLLACASYFEARVTTEVMEFCRAIAGKNPLIPSLVQNKAVTRQYHTWFDWTAANANSFFGLFGPDFKRHMAEVVRSSDQIGGGVVCFLQLGRDRNRLVHEDFATFAMEATADEIYEKFQKALPFIDRIGPELRVCSDNLSAA